MTRRIAITGMGAVTPLAVGVEESWEKLCAGDSGIKNVTQFDASSLKCQVAGEIRDFVAEDFLRPKKIRRADRFVHFLFLGRSSTSYHCPHKNNNRKIFHFHKTTFNHLYSLMLHFHKSNDEIKIEQRAIVIR